MKATTLFCLGQQKTKSSQITKACRRSTNKYGVYSKHVKLRKLKTNIHKCGTAIRKDCIPCHLGISSTMFWLDISWKSHTKGRNTTVLATELHNWTWNEQEKIWALKYKTNQTCILVPVQTAGTDLKQLYTWARNPNGSALLAFNFIRSMNWFLKMFLTIPTKDERWHSRTTYQAEKHGNWDCHDQPPCHRLDPWIVSLHT